jgi:PAS domain S-box-containing protein
MLHAECPAPCLLFEAVRSAEGVLLDFQWTSLNPAAEGLVRALGVGRSLSLWNESVSGLPSLAVLGRVVETGQPQVCPVSCRLPEGPRGFQAQLLKHAEGVTLWLFEVKADSEQVRALQQALEEERAARARAEQTLAAYDAILREAPVGFAYLDPELRHVKVGPVFARLEGLTPEAAVGAPLAPSVAPLLAPLGRRVLESGQPMVQELSPEAWPGQPFPGDWQVTAFPVNVARERIGLGMVLTDISERMRAVRSLRAREEHLRLALETAQMVTWEWSQAQSTVTWSPNAPLFFGRPAANLGSTLRDFLPCVHPEDRHWVTQAIEQGLRAEGPYTFQFRGQWPDGTVRCYEAVGQTFHERGQPARMLGVVTDCTARDQTQSALREAEERYRLATQATNDVLYDWSPLTQHIHWGEACAIVFGFTQEEMGNLDWWTEHIHPEDRARVMESLGQVVWAGGESWSSEYRFLHKNGSYIHVLDRGLVSRDEKGHTVRMIGSMMDITERKHAVERMQQEALFRERFIGMLGHDLRNPLNAILLSAQTLSQSDALPATLLKTTARIDTSARRMLRMISDLLDLTRARLAGGIPLQLTPTRMPAVCRQVVEELAVAHPGRILLEVEGECEGVWDSERLAQVLSNLVANALEHGATGTSVRVRCHSQGERQVLEVSNVGPPIPEEKLETLFDPFRQAGLDKGKRKGLGLGLYIVREIVHAHGGTVAVRSSGEEGTTFTITLPRESRLASARRAEARQASAQSH